MLPPYTKPHLSFGDRITLLIGRGLTITDLGRAEQHLRRIGYGRLAPYWQPAQQTGPDPADPNKAVILDQFRPGAELRHAVDLYLSDKQLLFLDAIERIEVA